MWVPGLFFVGLLLNPLISSAAPVAINQIDPNAQQVDAAINAKSVKLQAGQYGRALNSDNSNQQAVFGEQIFAGGFSGVRADGLNPNYLVSPGDQVILRIWGAVNIDRVLPVDAQGNIFVPTIGPVNVSGVSHAALDAKVQSAVKAIYPNNVSVYTQLQGVQPVAVFVTGFVSKPGRYAGTPNDSVLYYLAQAQGVESATGSYRKIRVIRDEKVIAQIDLYEFITQGKLPKIQFMDGDTVFVEKRGTRVTVLSNDKPSLSYELKSPSESGAAFMQYASAPSNTSHVLVQGTRSALPFSEYLTLQTFKEFNLNKDDQIHYVADKQSDTIVVKVEGSYVGRSYFVTPKNARLKELLNNIEVDPELAQIDAISIKRQSVAKQQKASLDASLSRLENTYLSASSSTAEEASIRIKEAELISSFVARAAEVQPNGRLVVATSNGLSDIRLQAGDVITIPSKSESVLISGQVLVPQSIVYQSGLSIEDYIQRSGGLTDQANPDSIIIVRQSGEVIADASETVQPGDEIMVLPKVPTKNIELAKGISQILYQIAIAAKVALNL